jgi:hypothetical protein
MADTPEHASDYLRPLLSFAAAHVPVKKHRETPLYILCTAGMRLLPERWDSGLSQDLGKRVPCSQDGVHSGQKQQAQKQGRAISVASDARSDSHIFMSFAALGSVSPEMTKGFQVGWGCGCSWEWRQWWLGHDAGRERPCLHKSRRRLTLGRLEQQCSLLSLSLPASCGDCWASPLPAAHTSVSVPLDSFSSPNQWGLIHPNQNQPDILTPDPSSYRRVQEGRGCCI